MILKKGPSNWEGSSENFQTSSELLFCEKDYSQADSSVLLAFGQALDKLKLLYNIYLLHPWSNSGLTDLRCVIVSWGYT